MRYYVETYRSHAAGLRVRAVRESDWTGPTPTMTALWHVEHVSRKDEAIAAVIEQASGRVRSGVTQLKPEKRALEAVLQAIEVEISLGVASRRLGDAYRHMLGNVSDG